MGTERPRRTKAECLLVGVGWALWAGIADRIQHVPALSITAPPALLARADEVIEYDLSLLGYGSPVSRK